MTEQAPILGQLRMATDALNAGDPEPLVALMDDSVDWRGVSPSKTVGAVALPSVTRDVPRVSLPLITSAMLTR